MNVSLTPELDNFVAGKVESGRYTSASEVVREALRLLEEHEAKASAPSREDLGRLIQTALTDSRPLIPAASLLRRRQRP